MSGKKRMTGTGRVGKVVAAFLALVLLLSLAACGNQETEKETVKTTKATSKKDSETDIETDLGTESETDSKILVVYFSATGSTKKVAETIAEHTGGDIFTITPKEEYTDADLDWTNEDSRVSVEHNNLDKRHVELVTTKVENFSEYDTVFLGYPIWWGAAAWPVDDFVKENDFTGKKVIPFCTAASSGIGESGTLLAEMAGTGEWQEGIRFYSSASKEEITDWVNGLDFLSVSAVQ